jgi:PAS domain-containing protein
MKTVHGLTLQRLLQDLLGGARAGALLERLEAPSDLPPPAPGRVPRATLAFALTALLFEDVVRRVPLAAAYVEDLAAEGRRLVLDHGALRTVAARCGALPAGRAAFARILEPLGFRVSATHDLQRISMTGFAYTHRDAPESVPQFFVSELHPERFDADFQAALARVVESSRDPLDPTARALLVRLSNEGALSHDAAVALLPGLVACFDRQHSEPALADYELLLERSAEAAWISTEGNAFNHATDRVEDVLAVADRQRTLGRPIKDRVEVSASGRVLQTAFRAASVERRFVDRDGSLVTRSVPGSFHEFISRRRKPDGALDLAFDASNAQGIFGMTDAGLAG